MGWGGGEGTRKGREKKGDVRVGTKLHFRRRFKLERSELRAMNKRKESSESVRLLFNRTKGRRREKRRRVCEGGETVGWDGRNQSVFWYGVES